MSAAARERGNEYLRTAKAEGQASAMRVGRAKDALKCYQEALHSSTSAEEWLSAKKNMVVAQFFILEELMRVDQEKAPKSFSPSTESTFYLMEWLVASFEALRESSKSDAVTEEWKADLDAKFRARCEKVFNILSGMTDSELRYDLLAKITSRCFPFYLKFKSFGASKFFATAVRTILNICVSATSAQQKIDVESENPDHEQDQPEQGDSTNVDSEESRKQLRFALRCLGATDQPMALAEAFLTAPSREELEYQVYLQDLQDLRDSLTHQKSLYESVLLRFEGDRLKNVALGQSEDLDVELILSAVDLYKSSSLVARGIDIEAEAIALSRQGFVWAKVMKNEQLAGEMYRRCLELANTLVPRNMTGRPWYREAVDFVQMQQQRKLVEEMAKDDEKKRPYREKQATEIAAIKKASEKSNVALLEHIYSIHPPKDGTKLGSTAPDDLKKTLRAASISYHPDKSHNKQNGPEWHVLSEEIAKFVNAAYEVLKGVSN
eukprot:TRINITY_DN8995_c0_g1_i1.p1 TRINITY_DN8995_c0_g1~~TRINITY_DN8995_c0_g1_i1.p1  ORF type:complete len:493 (-),score=119.84 TRINITY_DN8995_c0_g1_i1:13-1491(-)